MSRMAVLASKGAPPAISFRQHFEKGTAVGYHKHITASMLDHSWLTQLPKIEPENMLFIAEGVLFFLLPDDIAALFNLLTTHFPGATFAFDVLTEQYSRQARARLLAADAPAQWLITDESDITTNKLIVLNRWVIREFSILHITQ